MQRDGEMLREYDQSPQPLDETSPGRNTVDTAQTNQPGAGVGPSVTGKLATCTEENRLLQFLYAKTFDRSRIKTLEPRYVLPTRQTVK